MNNEICKTIIPPRKQQPCLAQSVENQSRQPSVPQAQQTENLAAGQKRIPLTKGMFAIVDESDYEELSKKRWSATFSVNNYYAKSADKNRRGLYMHRFLLNPPKGMCVDHINGNRLDNRRENLRIVTQAENCRAYCKPLERKKSKFRGVSIRCDKKKWCANITIGYKNEYLGSFDTQIEAAKAYNKRAIELGFYPEALNKFD